MWKPTLVGGALLMLVGIAGYVASGMASPTALIPAFFGVLIAGLALLAASKESLRMHAVHAALVLALLGALGSLSGVTKLKGLFEGTAERPTAVIAKVAMFVICAALVGLGVRGFLAARARRRAVPS